MLSIIDVQDPWLPAGVTQAMCDGDDYPCGSCGHLYSDHMLEDGDDHEWAFEKLIRVVKSSSDIEFNADGERVHACNMIDYTKSDGTKVQCECTAYNDEPPEPDWDSMNEDLD